MTNREIVDYILSNKLGNDEVIKETCKYYNDISTMYIYQHSGVLYDINGNVSITRFCDVKPQLSGNIAYHYSYEIISKEQATKEERIKELKHEIDSYKLELASLNKELREIEGEK